jgi:parvulin-like peptidyl-prolyl isomerase
MRPHPTPSLSRLRILSAALAASLALSCSAALAASETAHEPDSTEPVVVATVNGEEITLDRVERRLVEMHGEVEGSERGAFDLDKLMFRMVNDALLSQEARALGMHEEPSIRDKVQKLRRKLSVAVLERREIEQAAEPTEQELREAYAREYERLNLRVVTVKEREHAVELREKLEQGADMAAMAREVSIDPYRHEDGYVEGLHHRDVMTEIADLASEMSPGAIGGPISTSLGWSIVRLESIEPADPEKFDEREAIVDALVRARKAERLRQELGREMRSKYEVVIDEKTLASIYPEVQPDGRLIPSEYGEDVIVARVGERKITAADYAHELVDRWKRVRNIEAARAAMRPVLEHLVVRVLEELEAEARGYDRLPRVRAAVKDLETQLLVTKYLDEVVASDIEITAEDVRAEYAEHEDEFQRPPRLRIGQVTVATADQAQRVKGLLEEGADLAWVARAHSKDRFASSGGDRGWIVPEGPGEDKAMLRRAEAGDVLGPFGSEGNFVVLAILARQEQGRYSMREVSGNIRRVLYSEEFTAALHEYVTKLRERAEIEVDEKALESLTVRGSFEPTGMGEGGTGAHAH